VIEWRLSASNARSDSAGRCRRVYGSVNQIEPSAATAASFGEFFALIKARKVVRGRRHGLTEQDRPPPSGGVICANVGRKGSLYPPYLLGFRGGLCSLLAALPMQIRNGGGQHSVLGAPRCEPIARRYASGEILR
jgi:hypothetical protein